MPTFAAEMEKKRMQWAMVGLPDDTGVSNVGGRTGAALGPDYFRQAFDRLHGPDIIKETFTDLGNAEMEFTLEDNHASVRQLIESAESYDFMVVVGGGHDFLLPMLHAKETKNLGCINIDPHFDMREDKPQSSSGSALFTAIQQHIINPENMLSFGIQPFANSPTLDDYAKKKGVNVVYFDELRLADTPQVFKAQLEKLAEKCDEIVLSLDLDSLQAAYGPGVSAPGAEGFTPSEIISFIRMAAAFPAVKSLGIFELNPSLDIDNRTSVLAAVFAWHFAEVKLLQA